MKFSPTTKTFNLNWHIFSSSQLHVSVTYGQQAGTQERKKFQLYLGLRSQCFTQVLV